MLFIRRRLRRMYDNFYHRAGSNFARDQENVAIHSPPRQLSILCEDIREHELNRLPESCLLGSAVITPPLALFLVGRKRLIASAAVTIRSWELQRKVVVELEAISHYSLL